MKLTKDYLKKLIKEELNSDKQTPAYWESKIFNILNDEIYGQYVEPYATEENKEEWRDMLKNLIDDLFRED